MPPATDVIEQWLRSRQPAVIFDFNGTLSDDEHILFDIFSELFSLHLDWAMTPEDYRDLASRAGVSASTRDLMRIRARSAR